MFSQGTKAIVWRWDLRPTHNYLFGVSIKATYRKSHTNKKQQWKKKHTEKSHIEKKPQHKKIH